MAVPQHFSIVILDVEGSGKLAGPEKKEVREDLYALVRHGLQASGIAAASVRSEDRGDGVYLLISAEVSKRLLIGPFIGTVDEGLAERRQRQPGLRLRLVVHHGEVLLDAEGSSGGAIDTAFAMVDSAQLRTALRDAEKGRMAVVVPDDLYQSVVRGYPTPDPQKFRMRQLETKRGKLRTWVTVTGAEEQPGGGARPADTPVPVTPQPSAAMHIGDQYGAETNFGLMGPNSGTAKFKTVTRDRGSDR